MNELIKLLNKFIIKKNTDYEEYDEGWNDALNYVLSKLKEIECKNCKFWEQENENYGYCDFQESNCCYLPLRTEITFGCIYYQGKK